ncbi:L,D-transpeptidase family protein [Patescibacteria group bacterium]|nr:L,D-transpeptidase family protein [Patescibacteria group bacterium]
MNHSFDWRGFVFFFALCAALIVSSVVTHFGILYASTDAEAVRQASVVIPPPAERLSANLAAGIVPARRVIDSLQISDVIPKEGKFISADLVAMKLFLYENGTIVNEFPIQSKGKPGTSWETPSGFYSIKTKEEVHYSTIGKVYMPFSMQFYGNYFIHGWTYYPDGTPVSASYSGGCIKLTTEDAQKVFAFADIDTGVFVYDKKTHELLPSIALADIPLPNIAGEAYLIADIDTGDVYAEKDSSEARPIASVTKLMTALVANELISFEQSIPIENVELKNGKNMSTTTERFLVGDLLYPLLLESNNAVANRITKYYGEDRFVDWMNTTAQALGMHRTSFADGSGVSPENLSTPDDLFRLLRYLADKKSFALTMTRLKEKEVSAKSGAVFKVTNVNDPVFRAPFLGGKAGQTTAAGETMAAVISLSVNDVERRIAVIVLKSPDRLSDTLALSEWVKKASVTDAQMKSAACVVCTETPEYRKIEP